jgi:hypothetical protein
MVMEAFAINRERREQLADVVLDRVSQKFLSELHAAKRLLSLVGDRLSGVSIGHLLGVISKNALTNGARFARELSQVLWVGIIGISTSWAALCDVTAVRDHLQPGEGKAIHRVLAAFGLLMGRRLVPVRRI